MIQAILQHQIQTTPDIITALSQPGKPLSILADVPTDTSYAIQRIETLCKASLTFSWSSGSRRETSRHSYTFFQSEENFPFHLSRLPNEDIRELITEMMLKEANTFPKIEPDLLDPTTKLIYLIFTSPCTATRRQASRDLMERICPNDKENSVVTDTQNALVKKTIDATLLQHTGLFRSALLSQDINLVARTLIQTLINDKIEEILQERDRVGRVQQVLTQQLVANEKRFSNFTNECLNLIRGERNITQISELEKVECQILASNDLDTQLVVLRPKKLDLFAKDVSYTETT